jgi:hypothetical protein
VPQAEHCESVALVQVTLEVQAATGVQVAQVSAVPSTR